MSTTQTAAPLAPVVQDALERVLAIYTRVEPMLAAHDAVEAGTRIRDLVYLVETHRIPERRALAEIAKVRAFILG